MLIPKKTDNEDYRLDALRHLAILDSPAEERFDRITRISKSIFNVPISLVSLIDENRQWFKSCCGLSIFETSRDISFCAHTILGDSLFIVEDAVLDTRFADNPLVTGEPYIRFYAGYPLEIAGGFKLGTLCIIDHKPRFFNEQQYALLIDLAALIKSELETIQLALLDELTGITNRRGFIILADKILQSSYRNKNEAILLFLDLNKFKEINDTLGHNIGDDALKQMALLLPKIFRNADLFARLGGDEFVVLLPGTDAANLQKIKSKLELELEKYNSNSNKPYNLSCSVGFSVYEPSTPPDLDKLLHDADINMYHCKNRK
ncbi:sensor domain-containing diguanylate cyclase [Aeromonas hydrophila]|uniref:sensor domain-containing diguanylate cyclase n=1 Tax=Aeromonas hydrophila TaxID=644 RepID=UPI0009B7F5A3|nr:sensor domain-containing diguanylate cyclase [Aeromonas hydrophila]